MGDLVVDLDGLSSLASTLRRINAGLERARGELRGHEDALGDEDVAEALDRFEDRWRDGRQEIRENGETLATMLSESVRAYRETDARLGGSLSVSASEQR